MSDSGKRDDKHHDLPASETSGSSKPRAAKKSPVTKKPLAKKSSGAKKPRDAKKPRALEHTPDPSKIPAVEEPRGGEGDFERLFALWRESGDPVLRERLILMHRNLVSFLARRFADRSDGIEDVVQQGMIGLIYALDHFDPARGVRFATFATPTIAGEIRRYFRDKTRGVRLPRRVQELHQAITLKVEHLTQQLGRSPTYQEIAYALHLPVEEVIETLETTRVLETVSLDEPAGSEGSISFDPLIDQLGQIDPALARADERSLLIAALQRLPEKQRLVLIYAYFENQSQIAIAHRLQVSQMHISRLLKTALSNLRRLLEAER